MKSGAKSDIIPPTMFGFGRFGHARQATRRLMAAVGVALMLGLQAFSAAYLAHESDHECSGESCQVCVQIQQCVANFQLAGSGFAADAANAPLPVTAADQTIPAVVVSPSLTLVSQKVQFNE